MIADVALPTVFRRLQGLALTTPPRIGDHEWTGAEGISFATFTEGVEEFERVLAEQSTGMHVDPFRLQWARDILAFHDAREAAQAERAKTEGQAA